MESPAAQENLFLFYSVIMGIYITFLYDLLRIGRRVITHNGFWVSVEDLAFWIYCAMKVFTSCMRKATARCGGLLFWEPFLACFYIRKQSVRFL